MEFNPRDIRPPRQTRQAHPRQPFDASLLCQKLEALIAAEQTARPQTHSPQPHHNTRTVTNDTGASAAHKPSSSPPAHIRKRSRPIITADGKPCVDPAYLEAVLSIHLTENTTRPNASTTYATHRCKSAVRPSTALDVSRREHHPSLSRINEDNQARRIVESRPNPRIRSSSCDLDAGSSAAPKPGTNVRSTSAMHHHQRPATTVTTTSKPSSKIQSKSSQPLIRVTHGTQTHYEPAADAPTASQAFGNPHKRSHKPQTKATESDPSPKHRPDSNFCYPDLFSTSDEDTHPPSEPQAHNPVEYKDHKSIDEDAETSRPKLHPGRRAKDRPNWTQTSQYGEQFQGRLGFFSRGHKSRAAGESGEGGDAEDNEDILAVMEAVKARGRTAGGGRVETGTLVADAVQRLRETERMGRRRKSVMEFLRWG